MCVFTGCIETGQNPFTLYATKGTIAGVVADFHFKDMHQKIGPCVLFWKPGYMGQLYVKAAAGIRPKP